MGNNLLSLIRTDLIQARILKNTEEINWLKFIFYFFRSKTCRVHTFVRLRSKNKILAYLAKKYLDCFFIEIGQHAEIGEYFWMPHPRSIIIADMVRIGTHVHIAQGVTIGGNFKLLKKDEDGKVQKLPIVGNRVVICSGAVIGGPVTIRDDIIIGANSVVTKDIPSRKIVTGQNQLSNKNIVIPDYCGHFEIMEVK